MKVGYARTSSVEQVAGLAELEAVGVENIISERVCSVGLREKLEAVLEFVTEGDCLVLTKLDRLARSMADLIAVNLRILAIGLDTATATGRSFGRCVRSRLPHHGNKSAGNLVELG
jgi:DNA invertase Pin-like site-specific DNA recombinase